MSRAAEQALKAYPPKMEYSSMISVALNNKEDANIKLRDAFIKGYEQAKQDYIEYAQLWVDSGEVNIKSFKQFLKDRGYE